jgi:predicted transcriptional regulator
LNLGNVVFHARLRRRPPVDGLRAEVAMLARGFGDLEAAVMNKIWDRRAAVTVRDIFDDLSRDRQIAYTTVLSTMDNLHRKRWLERERDGKAYVYQPVMSREERSARLMREAMETGGDADAVLAFFVEQMSPDESAQLKAVIRRVSGRRR